MKTTNVKNTRKGSRRKDGGFSLIELLIAMAVVLLLVGGIVIAGERSLQAGRESSAAQSVGSFQADETTYQRSWGGFSSLAASLGGAGSTTAAVCTADQELVTTTGANAFPAAYDAGTAVNGGYTFTYKAGGTGFAATGVCGNQVFPTYEFTANPVDLKTKAFCSDSTGVYYLPAPTPMTTPPTGAGCLADNSAALAIGQ
jgi:prepilin-type N-terminal cleavage/methylation domain-containing protein